MKSLVHSLRGRAKSADASRDVSFEPTSSPVVRRPHVRDSILRGRQLNRDSPGDAGASSEGAGAQTREELKLEMLRASAEAFAAEVSDPTPGTVARLLEVYEKEGDRYLLYT